MFRALRMSTAITVSVFTLIAGLAMFNTLAMIVMEKTKEIAILRSMGYTRQDISRIFLWQAAIVLMLGTVAGWVLGAVVTYAISNFPIRIRGIFAADTFIVNWSIWHYVAATATVDSHGHGGEPHPGPPRRPPRAGRRHPRHGAVIDSRQQTAESHAWC